MQRRAVGIVAGEDVLKAGLGRVGRPVGGGNDGFLGLAGRADELAAVQIGLQDAHGAVKEEVDVVVAGVAGDELNVEGAFRVVQIQGVADELALRGADEPVVEGGVVGNGVGVHDQAVIGDDGDARFLRLGQNGAEGVAVDGGDDQDLAAVGDHVLDLGDLGGDVIGAELQVDGVARGLELGLHVLAVLVPALQILGGHRNADQAAVAGRSLGLGGGVCGSRLLAAGRECEDHAECEEKCE